MNAKRRAGIGNLTKFDDHAMGKAGAALRDLRGFIEAVDRKQEVEPIASLAFGDRIAGSERENRFC